MENNYQVSILVKGFSTSMEIKTIEDVKLLVRAFEKIIQEAKEHINKKED
jgi:hypothetical protein